MFVKAFIVNVINCPKPFFLEQHINTVNTLRLKAFCLSVAVVGLIIIIMMMY